MADVSTVSNIPNQPDPSLTSQSTGQQFQQAASQVTPSPQGSAPQAQTAPAQATPAQAQPNQAQPAQGQQGQQPQKQSTFVVYHFAQWKGRAE